jgi:hypothetical protein
VLNAVEFQAIVKNGMIEIPREYRKRLSQRVRVIVLAEEERKAQPASLIDDLLLNPIKIEGFRPLTRDEAHARD